MPGFHPAFAFDRYLANIFAFEIIFNQFVGLAGDLDLAALTVAFHAAGGIDHISPQGIQELFTVDHACDERA